MSPPHKRKRGQAAPPVSSQWPEADNARRLRPETTKKSANACTSCRKQKIRCVLPNDELPCVRCQTRGLDCALHIPCRQPVVVETRQFGLLSKDLLNVHSTLERICQRLEIEAPQPLVSEQHEGRTGPTRLEEDDDGLCELSPPASPSAAQAPIDGYLQAETSPDDGSPQRTRRGPQQGADLVTKSIVTAEQAEILVQRYMTHLDRFLYGIASHYTSAEAIRKASPALFAAICTVSAFQNPEQRDLFEVCNREYRSIVSSSLFEKRDAEFIRALCIGSFWLPNASRILVSDAIRRAADCRLQRHFCRLAEPMAADELFQTRDAVRLWYLLFVSDQHLSILHNRDPVMRQDKEMIEHRDLLLPGDQSYSQDIRIVSQVSLLVIMCQVRDVFGSEQAKPVAKSSSFQFTQFSRELDQWFAKYSPLFEPDTHIGDFPLAGLMMHYQFGKLYLGHHVFRGLNADPVPLHFLPAATTAIEAAITIFTIVLDNEAFRSRITGMPHYFHIMISFAGHFLMEVCMKHREQLNLDAEAEYRRISAVLAVFARTGTIPQHPIARITAGLMKKLLECTTSLGIDSVLAGSPFGGFEEQCTLARDFEPVVHHTGMLGALDNLGGTPDISSNFLYADFGDYTFNDTPFDFIT